MISYLLLHLSLIPGIGPATIKRLLDASFSLEDLYSFSIQDFQEKYGFSENIARLLVQGLADKRLLNNELELLAKHSIVLYRLQDVEYPSLLKTIHYPPPVLYVQGSLPVENPCLSMIGSRKADQYGKCVIQYLVPELVDQGIVLVSGGAIGADTLVHEATLQHDGKTVAVIGSGLLKPYPQSNKRLFEKIIENNGAIISPFPLTMQALPGNFPARNRIIAGMSLGCLVIQAAAQSGALITAHFALDEGRHVYAIPGQYDDPLSEGCHLLLKQGATLVTRAQDIVISLQDNGIVLNIPKDRVHVSKQNVKASYGIKAKQEHPLVVLCREPQLIDDLLAATQLDIATLSAQLFDLQLEGKLEQDFNGAWKSTFYRAY